MVDAPAVDGAIKPGEFYGTVSAEQAADLDSDVFLTWAETERDLKTFTERQAARPDPRRSRPATSYAESTTRHVALAVTNPTPLSIPFIDGGVRARGRQGRRTAS